VTSLGNLAKDRIAGLLNGRYRHLCDCPGELISFSMLVSRMVMASCAPNPHEYRESALHNPMARMQYDARRTLQSFPRRYVLSSRILQTWRKLGFRPQLALPPSHATSSREEHEAMSDMCHSRMALSCWFETSRSLAQDQAKVKRVQDLKAIVSKIDDLCIKVASGVAGRLLPSNTLHIHPCISAFLSLHGNLPLHV